jgi:hypothetical protein
VDSPTFRKIGEKWGTRRSTLGKCVVEAPDASDGSTLRKLRGVGHPVER